jgi:hypothetical protein
MKQLLEEIYDLYSRYTGQQIAQAIAQYRKEISVEQEVAEIDTKISALKMRRAIIKSEE